MQFFVLPPINRIGALHSFAPAFLLSLLLIHQTICFPVLMNKCLRVVLTLVSPLYLTFCFSHSLLLSLSFHFEIILLQTAIPCFSTNMQSRYSLIYISLTFSFLLSFLHRPSLSLIHFILCYDLNQGVSCFCELPRRAPCSSARLIP